ncbi:MAG: hypothetical protein IJ501_00295 [Bacilli bacterium]|nr:hypothetical protein [Bacilli bacterium]
MLNPILHVIPLTSKKHNYNIELNNLLYNESELNNLKELLSKEPDKNNIKKIKKCIKYYSKRKDKISYACIKYLKTVSKLSICKSINEFDYLNKVKFQMIY